MINYNYTSEFTSFSFTINFNVVILFMYIVTTKLANIHWLEANILISLSPPEFKIIILFWSRILFSFRKSENINIIRYRIIKGNENGASFSFKSHY